MTIEDVTQLEEQIGGLEERVGVIEQQLRAGQEQPDLVGQEVTVSAQVSEVITSNDAGGAFRVAGDSGPAVAVLATTPPDGLEVDDVVQISGTVQMVQRESFEQDFGIAENEIFEDPDAFFEENEGQPAIAAQEIADPPGAGGGVTDIGKETRWMRT